MAKNFIHRNIFLVVSTIIVKLLGLLFWIPLNRIGGAEAAGLYKLAYPYYAVILMIATAGIPAAVAKFVAERLACRDPIGAQRVLRAATVGMAVTSLAAALLLFFGADLLASLSTKKGNIQVSDLRPSLQVLALAVVTVPLAAALRGYFQGAQRVEPTSYSQVAEQIARVLLMILAILLLRSYGYGAAILSAGAMVGAVGGGLVALLIMSLYYYRSRKAIFLTSMPRQLPLSSYRSRAKERASLHGLIFALLRYAFPIALAALASGPLLGLIDSWTFSRLLPPDPHTATTIGIYGRSEPLAGVITAFAAVLAMNLIPMIASHGAKGERSAIHHKIQRSWAMTLVMTLPLAAMMAILAPSVMIVLYGDARGSSILALLAVATIFSNLSWTSAGILQGLGYNQATLWHLLCAVALKLGGNLLFIPLANSFTGAAWAMVFAYAVTCGLNISYTMRTLQVKLPVRKLLLKPFFCTLCMATAMSGTLWLLQKLFLIPPQGTLLHFSLLLLCGGLGSVVYGLLAIRLQLIEPQDLASLPFGKQWLTRLGGKNPAKSA